MKGEIMQSYVKPILLSAALILSAAPVAAPAPEGDRYSLSLGVFVTDRDTETRLDSAAGDGTDTDFESDLGLDASDTVFRVDGYYRFAERHRADFSVFDLSLSNSNQIERDIQL